MEFRVLGPVDVVSGSAPVRVPGGKVRVLLARLLVDAGRVVPVDALAEALWTEGPPPSAVNSLQVQVSNLRTALALSTDKSTAAATIETHGRGYAVNLDGHVFDAHVATDRLEASRAALRRGTADDALTEARAVSALFRGEPFADVAYCDWALAEARRLQELRLEAAEAEHEAALALGRHDTAIPQLEALVAAQPFRERTRGLLMLALYRAGRQADALRCYSSGRAALVDELGIEPGAELRELESRILAQDPRLDLRAAPVRIAVDPLIGRARERRELTSALDAVASGAPRMMLVEGEPGIGKTALANWFAGHASAQGALVGRGRAHDVGQAPPYWPWTEALRQLAEEAGPGTLSSLPPADQSVLGGVVPGLHGDAPPAETSPVLLFDAIVRFLGRLDATRPVVVLLDDLHWADDATLSLVRFVSRSMTASRLLLLAFARVDASGHSALRTLGADLATDAHVGRIRLAGLDEAEVAELAQRITGAPVEPWLAGALRERTGGNPFFVREVVQLMADTDGRLDPARVAVPASVRDVLHRRAALLGDHAEDVFTVLSFARDAFTSVLPDRLLDVPPSAVAAVIDGGIDAGLLVEVPGRPGFYRFAHNLVRHAFYDALPAARRAEIHLRVGQVLEEVVPRPLEIANQLAWHFTNAANVGGARDAVRWERIAARMASDALAHSDAVHHLRRALASVRKVLRDEELERDVLLEIVEQARLAGDDVTSSTAQRRADEITAGLGGAGGETTRRT